MIISSAKFFFNCTINKRAKRRGVYSWELFIAISGRKRFIPACRVVGGSGGLENCLFPASESRLVNLSAWNGLFLTLPSLDLLQKLLVALRSTYSSSRPEDQKTFLQHSVTFRKIIVIAENYSNLFSTDLGWYIPLILAGFWIIWSFHYFLQYYGADHSIILAVFWDWLFY